MNKAIGKLCAGLCFVGALALAPGCGDGDEKSGSCDDGQREATVNDQTGCYDECVEGMCAAGFACNSGLCIASGGGNTNNPVSNNTNTGTNNPTNGGTNNPTNGGTNNPTNNTNSGGPIDPATTALCEAYADLYYGSCFDSCTLDAELQMVLDDNSASILDGDGTAQNPGCARLLTDNPTLKDQIQMFVDTNTCETLEPVRCGEFGLTTECNCTPPTNLGAPCTDDTQCMGGSLSGVCLTEADNGIPGGECVAAECPSLGDQVGTGFVWPSEACGAGNNCFAVTPDDGTAPFGICRAGCAANADCRNDETCQPNNFWVNEDDSFSMIRACGAACAANADCGEGARCTTDGVCEFQCDDTPDPNDATAPTLADLCGMTGGTCTTDANDSMDYCVY